MSTREQRITLELLAFAAAVGVSSSQTHLDRMTISALPQEPDDESRTDRKFFVENEVLVGSTIEKRKYQILLKEVQ